MKQRLSLREKLGYGSADIGASLSYVAINTWLLYFLINVVGLEPLLAGLVFILGRFVDAVLDPAMGVISDKFKPHLGRKPFIVWGAVPFGLSFALLWLSPDGSQIIKFLAALAFLTLFSVIYTVVQVPYMALTPELATDYDERTSLTSFRMAFGTLASLIAVAVPPLIIGALSQTSELAQTKGSSWLIMGLIFGVTCTLAYLVMALSVKEPRGKVSQMSQTSFMQEYHSAFAIFGFKSIFFLFIVVTIGLMIINSILPFFLESNLHLGANQQSVVLGPLFITAILTFPFWNLLAARAGKRFALALGLGIMAVAVTLLVTFAHPNSLSAYLLLMTLLAGTGLSAVMLFPWAMLPDVVEFDELSTGRRREGLVYALFTFGQKLAGSVGVFSNALVASIFDYQQGAVEQSATTLAAIKFMAGPAAALVFVLAIFITLRFPITRAMHQAARAKLAAH